MAERWLASLAAAAPAPSGLPRCMLASIPCVPPPLCWTPIAGNPLLLFYAPELFQTLGTSQDYSLLSACVQGGFKVGGHPGASSSRSLLWDGHPVVAASPSPTASSGALPCLCCRPCAASADHPSSLSPPHPLHHAGGGLPDLHPPCRPRGTKEAAGKQQMGSRDQQQKLSSSSRVGTEASSRSATAAAEWEARPAAEAQQQRRPGPAQHRPAPAGGWWLRAAADAGGCRTHHWGLVQRQRCHSGWVGLARKLWGSTCRMGAYLRVGGWLDGSGINRGGAAAPASLRARLPPPATLPRSCPAAIPLHHIALFRPAADGDAWALTAVLVRCIGTGCIGCTLLSRKGRWSVGQPTGRRGGWQRRPSLPIRPCPTHPPTCLPTHTVPLQCVFEVFFELSICTLSWVIATEICPLEIRSIGAGFHVSSLVSSKVWSLIYSNRTGRRL